MGYGRWGQDWKQVLPQGLSQYAQNVPAHDHAPRNPFHYRQPPPQVSQGLRLARPLACPTTDPLTPTPTSRAQPRGARSAPSFQNRLKGQPAKSNARREFGLEAHGGALLTLPVCGGGDATRLFGGFAASDTAATARAASLGVRQLCREESSGLLRSGPLRGPKRSSSHDALAGGACYRRPR